MIVDVKTISTVVSVAWMHEELVKDVKSRMEEVEEVKLKLGRVEEVVEEVKSITGMLTSGRPKPGPLLLTEEVVDMGPVDVVKVDDSLFLGEYLTSRPSSSPNPVELVPSLSSDTHASIKQEVAETNLF